MQFAHKMSINYQKKEMCTIMAHELILCACFFRACARLHLMCTDLCRYLHEKETARSPSQNSLLRLIKGWIWLLLANQWKHSQSFDQSKTRDSNTGSRVAKRLFLSVRYPDFQLKNVWFMYVVNFITLWSMKVKIGLFSTHLLSFWVELWKTLIFLYPF